MCSKIFLKCVSKCRLTPKMVHEIVTNWNWSRPSGSPRLTHRQIARDIGVSPSYWSQVLAGVIPSTKPLLDRAEVVLKQYKIQLKKEEARCGHK